MPRLGDKLVGVGGDQVGEVAQARDAYKGERVRARGRNDAAQQPGAVEDAPLVDRVEPVEPVLVLLRRVRLAGGAGADGHIEDADVVEHAPREPRAHSRLLAAVGDDRAHGERALLVRNREDEQRLHVVRVRARVGHEHDIRAFIVARRPPLWWSFGRPRARHARRPAEWRRRGLAPSAKVVPAGG